MSESADAVVSSIWSVIVRPIRGAFAVVLWLSQLETLAPIFDTLMAGPLLHAPFAN